MIKKYIKKIRKIQAIHKKCSGEVQGSFEPLDSFMLDGLETQLAFVYNQEDIEVELWFQHEGEDTYVVAPYTTPEGTIHHLKELYHETTQ